MTEAAEQGEALPLMVPGCAGTVLTVTGIELAELLPQVLLAVTETLPKPPAIAVIELVAEVPVHPEGNDHV